MLSDLIVCPISSQPRYYRKPGKGDVPIGNWRAIHLRHPSTVRISKLLSVDKQIVKSVLGSLGLEDLARVEEDLREALNLE